MDTDSNSNSNNTNSLNVSLVNNGDWIRGKLVKGCSITTKNDYRFINQETVEVKLTKGYSMLVDSEDMKVVNLCSWHASNDGYGVYAQGQIKSKNHRFHRLIMQCPSNRVVDHISGSQCDTALFLLDNRKQNLRIVTAKENSNNAALLITNTSGVNGVRQRIEQHRSYFVAFWKENYKQKEKAFTYGRPKSPYRTEAEAREAAIAFRVQKDLENGCTNGNRLSRKRKMLEQQQQEQQQQQNPYPEGFDPFNDECKVM